uniref:Carboxylic ester hydrolase n=1 Tax=Panagrolaimus superbus TaxID=310955 RepID=A0A914Z5F9_9BILA
MFLNYFILSLLFSAFFVTADKSYPRENDDDDSKLGIDILTTRKLSNGYIRGRQLFTPGGVEGFVFLSIPIAENPIGDLRFKRPIPRKPWDKIYDATEYKVSCFWNSTITTVFTSTYNMSEDCIHLNIFTNKYCLIKGNCAVVLYIHGGEFGFGSPLQLNQSFLVDNFNNVTRDIVFVAAGFRAAAFGILNLNWKLNLSSDMNPALHDIVHALEWIQKEIHVFGGNKDRVTVMGHSGGAVIADYLSVSPYAQKLFNQVVIMSRSGGNLVPDRNQRASRRMANKVGCTNMGLEDGEWEDQGIVEGILQCLRNKSALELSAQQPLGEQDGMFFNGPALDYGDYALLPSIYQVLDKQRRKIPVLTGTVSKEWLDSRDTVITAFDVDQNKLRYWCTRSIKVRGYNTSESTVLLCMNEYNTTSKSIFLWDDVSMYAPQLEMTNSFAAQSDKVYLYQFEYDGIGDAYFAGDGLPQPHKEEYPGHSHELIYLIGQHLGNFTAKDHQIKFLYSQIFVDFIKNGSPKTKTRKWDKFNSKDKNFFVIDFPDPTLESPGMKDDYHKEAYEFWHKTVPKYAGIQYIPLSEKDAPIIINGIKGLEDPELQKLATTLIPEVNSPYMTNTNWELMFWIALALAILMTIALCCTCVIARRKRETYETL